MLINEEHLSAAESFQMTMTEMKSEMGSEFELLSHLDQTWKESDDVGNIVQAAAEIVAAKVK